MGGMKSVAAYLALAPAISATRSRPEQIEFSNNILHHPEQWAQVPLRQRRRLALDAACDCSRLRALPEQARAFHTADREWRASYWQPLQINREFASHFAPPALWRRRAIWLLRGLLSRLQSANSSAVQTALPLQSAS